MTSLLVRALGGVIATVPMTVAMEVMFRQLPRSQRRPLPPRPITAKLAHTLPHRDIWKAKQLSFLTLANHLVYGGALAMLYTPRVQRTLPGIAGGAVFGLGVWAVNYLAVLPATPLRQRVGHSTNERRNLMIAAHLVWGATLGLITSLEQRERKAMSQRTLAAPPQDQATV